MYFANAGVGQPIPLGSITEEHFDIQHQCQGLLFTVQKALPLMPEGATIPECLNAIVGTPAFSVWRD